MTTSAQVKNSFGLTVEMVDQNVELLNSRWTAFDSALSTRVRAYYQRGLSPSWSFQVGVFGGGVNYLRTKEQTVSNASVVGGDIRILLTLNNGRLIKQDALIGPFLMSGYEVTRIGGPMSSSFWNLNYGAGMNIRVSPRFNVRLTSLLNQRLTDNFNTSLVHGIGGMYSIPSKEESKRRKDQIKDSDLDGIADINDKCPNEAGSQEYYGCPNSVALAQALNPVEESNDGEAASTDELERLEALVRTLYKENDSLKYELNQSRLKIRSLDRRLIALENGERVEKREQDEVIPKRNVNENSPLIIDQDLYDPSGEKPKPVKKKTTPPVEQKRSQPETKPTNEQEKFNYYVVTISTPTISLAQQWKADLSAKFPKSNVKIYTLDNGYMRVGLYETRSKDEAIRRMEEVRSLGHPKAWVAKYPVAN